MNADRIVSEPTSIARDRNDRTFDCVVVGAGVNGLAAARALARTGAHTALLEQFSLYHAHGSSHGDSRSIRHYPEPEWMALWREAEALWNELEDETGVELLQPVGVLTHGRELLNELDSLVSLGVPAAAVDAGETLLRFGIRMPPTGESYFDPTSGYILAARACQALATSCIKHGVTIVEGAKVSGLSTSAQEVNVSTTTHGPFTANVAIVTAGAWARDLLSPLGIRLPVYVSRETVAYFGAPGQASLPVIVDYTTAGEVAGKGIYALPSPSLGLKVAAHHSGVRSEELPRSREADPRVVARLSRWVSEHLPGLDATATRTETCLYTVAPDEELLLFRDGRVVVGSACSGHAFKFATATGQRLASLAAVADLSAPRPPRPDPPNGVA